VNRLRVTHKCDRQRDRRTDILLADAAFNYVARQKLIKSLSLLHTKFLLPRRVIIYKVALHASYLFF